MNHDPEIQVFFDETTHTASYLVSDSESGQAAIIDPVLDYDPRSARAFTRSADAMLAACERAGLTLSWILETHAHADHLSAAHYLRWRTGARVGIGEHIREVQKIFAPVFALDDLSGTGEEFDRLFSDGERFAIGALEVEVMHTPGHTPACVAYRIGRNVFVGDTLFMPDYGTARADFPGGSARTLYRSIQRLLALPDDTRLYMCHDYKAPGRDHYACWSTVREQRERNIHVRLGIEEGEFVILRERRDAALPAPDLLLPSIQVNVRAGRLPRRAANGTRYLELPMKLEGTLAEVP